MRNLSLQEKEQEIVATIIACNKEINPNNKNNNMIQLYESIVGFVDNKQINYENIEINNKIKFSDYRKNKLFYLQQVNNFLNESENNPDTIDIIINLNESIQDSEIINFRNDLNKNIEELLKSNDFNKLDILDKNILRIKILANKPIYVLGFDIMNNYHLQEELKNVYNLNIVDIISILFDKSNKQLFFVFDKKLFNYVLETNEFDYYKIQWDDLNNKNYLSIIKNEINANIVEIYINKDNLDFKFQDNLFCDIKKSEEIIGKTQYRNNNLFVKS